MHAEVAGRISTSRFFRQSPRLARFLAFTVDNTLAGSARDLKEYLIGIEVYSVREGVAIQRATRTYGVRRFAYVIGSGSTTRRTVASCRGSNPTLSAKSKYLQVKDLMISQA